MEFIQIYEFFYRICHIRWQKIYMTDTHNPTLLLVCDKYNVSFHFIFLCTF